MLLIARNVGRLVEVRFAGNPTDDDITGWTRACEACLRECITQTGKGAVCLTDLRSSRLFSPAATERIISLMRKDNAVLERNTVLVTTGAVATLQLQRMVRESSGDVRRRVFVDVEPALIWTEERLTPPERSRLREFVSESERDVVGPRGGFFHWRSTDLQGPASSASGIVPDGRRSSPPPPDPGPAVFKGQRPPLKKR